MPRLQSLAIAIAFAAVACGGSKSSVVKSEAPAKASFGFSELSGDTGLILAKKVGGTVEMRALETGDTLMLTDGHGVIMKQQFAADETGRAEAQIIANDLLGVVPNAAVVTAARLRRAPNTKHLLFQAIQDCQGKCKTELWLLDDSGDTRLKLGDSAGGAATMALRKDGAELAIGSAGLYLVDLDELTVRRYPEFTAPSYAPDGALYARGAGEDDTAYEIDRSGMAAEVARMPGNKSGGEPAAVRFERGGTYIVVDFMREGESKQVRKERR